MPGKIALLCPPLQRILLPSPLALRHIPFCPSSLNLNKYSCPPSCPSRLSFLFFNHDCQPVSIFLQKTTLAIQRYPAFWKQPNELQLTFATCCLAALTRGSIWSSRTRSFCF